MQKASLSLTPWVSPLWAVGVTTVSCRCHCCGLWVSPLWAMGIAAAGCRCRCHRHSYCLQLCIFHHHHASPCSHAHCCYRLHVSLLLPYVLSVAVNVATATVGVIYGCECCCHHHRCHLWPCMWLLGLQYSHIIEKKKLVKKRKRKTPAVCLTAAVQSLLWAMCVVCGCACCCHHHVYCLWPCMLLQPCVLLLWAMHITAVRVVCGHRHCHCEPCMLLLGLQYSHVIEKK